MFVAAYGNKTAPAANTAAAAKQDISLEYAIENGLKAEGAKLTEELHKTGIRMIEETLSYLDEMINESEARKLSWVVDRHETKQLITSLGSVNYSKSLFKNKKSGKRSYIIDLVMGMDPHERMTEDAEARMLQEAVQTSYRRGGEETSVLDKVSKQTVMKKIHALQFPAEDEVLAEKKSVKVLYIDADEDHISLQYKDKKGDFTNFFTLPGDRQELRLRAVQYFYDAQNILKLSHIYNFQILQ